MTKLLIAPDPAAPRLTRAVTGVDHTGARQEIRVVEERAESTPLDRLLLKLHDRVEAMGMELLADIPKNEEIEDIAFDGQPMSDLENANLLSVVDSIIERIGGENETA